MYNAAANATEVTAPLPRIYLPLASIAILAATVPPGAGLCTTSVKSIGCDRCHLLGLRDCHVRVLIGTHATVR